MPSGLMVLLYKSPQLFQTLKTSAWNHTDNIHEVGGDPIAGDGPLISSVHGSVPVYSAPTAGGRSSNVAIDSLPSVIGSPELKIMEVRKLKRAPLVRRLPKPKAKQPQPQVQRQGGLGYQYAPMQAAPSSFEMSLIDPALRNIGSPSDLEGASEERSQIDSMPREIPVSTHRESVSRQDMSLVDSTYRNNDVYTELKPGLHQAMAFYGLGPGGILPGNLELWPQSMEARAPANANMRKRVAEETYDDNPNKRHKNDQSSQADIKPQTANTMSESSFEQQLVAWGKVDYIKLCTALENGMDLFTYARETRLDPCEVKAAFRKLVSTSSSIILGTTKDEQLKALKARAISEVGNELSAKIEMTIAHQLKAEGWVQLNTAKDLFAKYTKELKEQPNARVPPASAFIAKAASTAAATSLAAMTAARTTAAGITPGTPGLGLGPGLDSGHGLAGATAAALEKGGGGGGGSKAPKIKSLDEAKRDLFAATSMFEKATRAETRKAKLAEKEAKGKSQSQSPGAAGAAGAAAAQKKLGRPPKKGDGYGKGAAADLV